MWREVAWGSQPSPAKLNNKGDNNMKMIRHEGYIIVDKDWLFNNTHEIKISYPNLIEIMGIGSFENKEELKKLNSSLF